MFSLGYEGSSPGALSKSLTTLVPSPLPIEKYADSPSSTGASGYIGGTALVHIVKQHPEWSIKALVRDEASASTLKESFPKVNFVIGALDSKDVLIAESEKADVVLSKSDRVTS